MLRSTRFSFIALSFAVLTGAVVIACSDSVDTSADAGSGASSSSGSDTVGTPPVDDTPTVQPDAATGLAAPYHGNPLCHVDGTSCMPDDDAVFQSTSGCVQPAGPVPMNDGATSNVEVAACRIGAETDGGAGAICETGMSAGTDGAKCETGSDCAAGFDCVLGDKDTNACRHYCCSGTCSGWLANGSATFCDVQHVSDIAQLAPVCMPVKHCTMLLGDGECASDETCTIVNEDGDTGCVEIGDKNVGESCDEAHCEANLACLGQPGARKCYRLCRISENDCASTQKCVTNAAFQNPDDGICTDN